MKLMIEHSDAVQYVSEATEDGKKNHYISGIFMQSELKNKNGRIYPKQVVENQVREYQKLIEQKRAVSELGHPPTPAINLDKVSHLITEMKMDGNNVYGRARILNTPMGKIAQNLLDEGVQLGVSSRGVGTLRESNGQQFVNPDFRLTAVDIVFDPSAPDAFVNGIMESKEYLLENGVYVERLKQQVESFTKVQLDEGAILNLFKNFMNTLK